MSQATDAVTGPAAAAAGLPDLLYGEAETELRAAVRSLFGDRCGWREVLARTQTEQTYDTGLWRVLAADLGCAGLLIPESSGGAGASYREAAVVAEETGRAVAPVPFLGCRGGRYRGAAGRGRRRTASRPGRRHVHGGARRPVHGLC